MSLLRHLPNALTLCNLLCGCVGITFLFAGPPSYAIWFVMAACVFDFLDGFAARMLKVTSPIGKELDSLADMVTFGVYPALLMYQGLRDFNHPWFHYLAFLIAVCAALRLAKFNVDDRQVDGFIGLAVPANTLFIASFPYLFQLTGLSEFGATGPIVVTLLFSWLMISPIRLFALKFKHFGWKGNEVPFTFLAISVLLIGVFNLAGVALAIITYILLSLFDSRRRAGTGS
ncbi:MAG TPA: CDP-diacylglycerol--serine O-phosphatidyltransferase [Cyclobacteriaceae bacterium]|nr:CDP-diacylglycerol--serine O-phosphatidyltransferase [Cyclobacteriaceae bacterium]